MALGDLDLFEDEREVGGVTVNPLPTGATAALATSRLPVEGKVAAAVQTATARMA